MKNTAKLFALGGMLMILPAIVFSQNIPVAKEKKLSVHREVPDDPYIPNAFGNKKTSPAKTSLSVECFTTQVNVDAGGNNILGDAANEPSLAVNPSDPDRMVIGWRQFDNVNSNFRQAGFGYTVDGGQTWTFPGTIETGIFRSDPVLDFDADGFAYYNSLTSNQGIFTCNVFKSADGGAAWDAGADAKGGDKQWMTIDRSGGPGNGNIYSYWTSYYSSCYPGFHTRSVDAGTSFEDCVEVPGNPYWGTMTVGNDGELYVAGSGEYDGFVVAKSTSAWDTGSPVSWDFVTPVYMDGYITSSLSVNPVGLLGQVSIDVDRSNGLGRNNVYVLASVVRLSNSDSADVMFSRSTDGGLTWSDPLRINDDPDIEHYQWFGTMSVAPNGRIDVVWLDTRDAPAWSVISALYYSYSLDQGETWSSAERLSDPFDPHMGWPQQAKMGDYFDMESDSAGTHLAWANTLNGEQDVYYSYITPIVTGVQEKNQIDLFSLACFPNPFREQTTIRYSIPEACRVQLVISDVYGKAVMTLLDEFKPAGTFHVDLRAGFPAGYYVCRLAADGQSRFAGLVKVQ